MRTDEGLALTLKPAVIYAYRMVSIDDNQGWQRFRDAITKSASLAKPEKYQDALKLVDGSVAEAIRENQIRWVCALSHHGAVISHFGGDVARERHYYEQSLIADPENPRALFGLANIAREQGELEAARQYAERCYNRLISSDDEILKQGLFDMVVKHWPEVVPK